MMRKYSKPEIAITTYVAEKIMLLSNATQNDFTKSTIKYSDINFF